MFLFHMPRSSIHPMPNSFDATSQTWPKSCEISSLITETRNGEADPPNAKRDVALATVIAAIPARNSRRGIPDIGRLLGIERSRQIYTIEIAEGSRAITGIGR